MLVVCYAYVLLGCVVAQSVEPYTCREEMGFDSHPWTSYSHFPKQYYMVLA